MQAQQRPRTTPTTPQFPGQGYGGHQQQMMQQPLPGVPAGVHDCQQLNGGKALYLCQPFVKAALAKGSFKTITVCPAYVDGMEWVAVNLVDFFHKVSVYVSLCQDMPTEEDLGESSSMDYTWTSGPTKKQVKVPAPEYTDYVLTWAEKLIGDETMFPTKSGREFPSAFPKTAVHLYTQFLRIFAHLYHAHFRDILHLSLEAHLNSLFAHFLSFGLEFELLDPKECRAPKEGLGFVIGDLMDVRISCQNAVSQCE
ncbi:Maintenance of ploidy protein mob2 [Cystobasidiomycetes sp. EMM_F5]